MEEKQECVGFRVPLMDISDVPNVYVVQEMSMEQRYSLYAYEILCRVRSSGVEEALVRYIVAEIEPVGWKAIWRSTSRSSGLRKEYDFLVEVQDISQTKLEAEVRVTHLLPSLLAGDIGQDPVIIPDPFLAVPLCELHPVYDEENDGLFEKTAVAIENVRFFRENLWRPWDEDDDEDPVFMDDHLMHRLKLYYDILSGHIPSQTAGQIQQLLCKAKSIAWKIEDLQEEMNCSDFDLELKEADVLQCMDLNHELEKLHSQLQHLENPVLSALVARQNHLKSTVKNRNPDEPAHCHIVAEKLTADTLKKILEPLNGEAVVECHKTLSSALASTCDGDNILLLPGNYTLDGFGWLEDSVVIRGLGQTPEETNLLALPSDGDIFLNCSSKNLVLENIKLVASSSTQCTLMVHEGRTLLKSCSIFGAETGLAVISGARLDIVESSVQECLWVGVECHHGSIVNIQNSVVTNCQVAGFLLQGNNVDSVSQVSISSSKFLGNGFGIVVGSLDEKNAVIESRSDDFILQYVTEDCKIEGNSFKKNLRGNVGQASVSSCIISALADETVALSLIDAGDENDGNILNTQLWKKTTSD